MKKKVVAISAIVTLAALMLASCGTPSCPEIGGQAPNFTLETVQGESLSLSDFQGKPVIINFWSTRCGPCVIEMPIIQEVYDKQPNQGLVVLAINVSDSAMTAKDFVTSQGFTFAVLLDPGAKVFQRYCLPQAIPITLFIDGEGTIKAAKIGAFQTLGEIESMVESLRSS
jgi:peroxiredoxin